MALSGIEVEGVIIRELEVKRGTSARTGNPWKSQEFVIETREQYPRRCVFRVFGEERLAQFNLHQGDNVKVYLDINANPWKDRYITDISAFRVDHLDNAQPGYAAATPAGGYQAPTAGPAPTAAPAAGDDSDLPF